MEEYHRESTLYRRMKRDEKKEFFSAFQIRQCGVRSSEPEYPDTDLKRSMLIYHNFFLHIFPAKMKRHGLQFSYTFCLGGISCLLFIILTVTGILLMFHYTPSIERAYFDMQSLALIFNGKILRNLHRWSAHGMVVTVFLHMVRVFYTRSYRPPREFNWVIGIGLLILTLGSQLYRIPSPLGSIGLLGNYRGNDHHELYSLHWEKYSFLCSGGG